MNSGFSSLWFLLAMDKITGVYIGRRINCGGLEGGIGLALLECTVDERRRYVRVTL